MASAGLLFLMLMSFSFLISTSTSDDQKQLQETSSKTLDKVKYIATYIEKIGLALSPVMLLIPVHGAIISKVFSSAGLVASKINKNLNGEISLQDLIYEFDNLNSKLEQYHIEQKWETWASGAYHKPEIKINIAWTKFNTMLHSVMEAKDDKEKERHEKEFLETYSKYEPATKTLHALLTAKGTTFINPLGNLLAEHVKCHEKDIREYTVFIYKLIYKANTMNEFYYNLKGIKSEARVDEEAKIAYDAASIMFQIHKKCIINSMDFIKKDVETLIDKTKTRTELAKEVWSFLVKEYDRYDWMVVAFKTKKSNRPIKSLNSHILTGFTEVTKEGISVAVARQMKGTHTKTTSVKQTIGRCIDESVKCHKVAKKLSECTETMEGTPVTQTYTAVHAYIREAHDSYSTKEETDEEDEVSAAPEDQETQTPAVYIGKCKKYLGLMKGKFVVLIKSDEEIEATDPCSKLNCGGEERGKCVKVENMFLAMCECNSPYYGEHCEESLEDYKKYLKGEIVVESTQHNTITKL